MSKVLNIYSQGKQLELDAGKYKIDVLGGWGVKLGEFSIAFKHDQSQHVVECQKAFWPVQTYKFGRKARRIFIAEIPEAGFYTVEFKNPETIKLKDSNLFFSSFFENTVPPDKISVCIHQRYF
jgi:hypothetical protein